MERSVLELRFMYNLNQQEIGERIGYSQMHVSRLLRRALSRLETAAAAA
jgi:RNA polymerase sigma-B factor